MVFDTIEPHHISAICCESPSDAEALRNGLPPKHRHLVTINSYLFRPREDHAYWTDIEGAGISPLVV
jgi:hypothetical protein